MILHIVAMAYDLFKNGGTLDYVILICKLEEVA